MKIFDESACTANAKSTLTYTQGCGKALDPGMKCEANTIELGNQALKIKLN